MRLKSKQTNSFNNSKQQKDKKTPKIIGLGLIKLDFYINITEELIKEHKIDLSKINSPKDLTFLAESPALLDLVQMSTTDTLTNILLYVNKANIQKSFVELITLNPLRFKPEEEHLRKIFSHVTEHNYLFTNEMNVASTPNKISFAIKTGKKLLKYWDIIADYDPFAEEIKKEENLLNKNLRTEKNVIKEEEEIKEGKNMYTNSNIDLSQKACENNNNDNNAECNENDKIDDNNDDLNNENSKITDKNNFDNFNNHENSRIKTIENNDNSQNINDNDDIKDIDMEMMENQMKRENTDEEKEKVMEPIDAQKDVDMPMDNIEEKGIILLFNF